MSACIVAASACGSGFSPHGAALAQGRAQERYDALARQIREAPRAAPSLVPLEQAWLLRLPGPPAAAAAMDGDRIYVPLSDRLIAVDREQGRLLWSKDVAVQTPVTLGGTLLFSVAGNALRALDARTGADRWSAPVDMGIAAPLLSDSGWVIAVTAAGEVVAYRAADGHLIWRTSVGAPSRHAAVAGGRDGLFLALDDGRVMALSLESGALRWERQLPGQLSPPAAAPDRVFVGSTDNFLYALDAETGRDAWAWRNGGDVIGAAVDGDRVYFASLDNVIRAVNRGNGNQRWRKPSGTRPVLPPRAFRGLVVVPGLMPALTVFDADSGESLGEHTASGALMGPPLLDPDVQPFRVASVTLTREGVLEAWRPVELMFRESAPVPVSALPGRALAREPRAAAE